MIHHLDVSLRGLLRELAPEGSELAEADISFEVPDAEWRSSLETLTLNCYLYRLHENHGLRPTEPIVQRTHPAPGGGNGEVATGRRRPAPVPIDCSYCLTAWSTAATDAAAEEHQLLSEVLEVLLRHRVWPPGQLWGELDDPITPYPVVQTFAEDLSTPGEFWTALDHPVKPSLNCVLTVAAEPALPDRYGPVELVQEVEVTVPDDAPEPPGSAPPGDG